MKTWVSDVRRLIDGMPECVQKKRLQEGLLFAEKAIGKQRALVVKPHESIAHGYCINCDTVVRREDVYCHICGQRLFFPEF